MSSWAAILVLVSSVTPVVGESLELREGETASVEGADLSLRFVKVRVDTRCPEDVDCVWAGEAVVVLAVSGGEAEPRELELHLGGDAVACAGAAIRLVALAPARRSDREIEPGSYRATLEISE